MKREIAVTVCLLAIFTSGAVYAGKPPPPPTGITSVTAGPGLQGGGSNGDVTLSLTSCDAGQVLVWDGDSTWQCMTGGDVTSVTAGSGLSGGGNSGPVTVALMSCPSGHFMKSNDTGWGCEPSAVSEVVAPVVVDSTGKVVGPVVPFDVTDNRYRYLFAALYRTGTENIKILFGGQLGTVHAESNGAVVRGPYERVHFDAPNCTGNAYFTSLPYGSYLDHQYDGYSLVPVYQLGEAVIAFRPDFTHRVSATLLSWSYGDGVCSDIGYGLSDAWSATTEALSFTPPFKVR